MSLKPRRIIENMPTVVHGGFVYNELAELGLKPKDIIDFSVSTNPFMPPPHIRDSFTQFDIERYPDSNATELTRKLAERYGLAPDTIVAGSGTTEIIRAVTMAYIRSRDTVLILEPTYGEYEPSVRLAGGRITKLRAEESNGFKPDVTAVIKKIQSLQPRAAFICNPNNPTGVLLSRNDIERIADSLGDTLLVMDEAYMTFIEAGWSSLDLTSRANIVVMRSMTKDYGLPGLRLGYAVAPATITRQLRKVLPPWNVSGPAQAAGLAVLDMDEYLAETITRLREANDYLVQELNNLNYKVLPSAANYFLVKTGKATEFRKSLLRYGLMVRDCTSFGLPDYIRIAPRSLPECQKLVEAFRSVNMEKR